VETHDGLVQFNYTYMGTCAPSAKRAVPASPLLYASRGNDKLDSTPPLGLAQDLLDHGEL
jgi:hypothetical protein